MSPMTPMTPLSRTRIALVLCVGSIALLVHARLFDFVCDDAFITFRFARNLVEHGAPVYNLGERVEGYTNFLWMLLVAGAIRLGADAARASLVLGALAGVAVLVSASAFYRRLSSRAGIGVAFVVGLLATSAPLAAWTSGGLETALFTALATTGCVLAVDAAIDAPRRRAALAGLVLASATLTRPEGALFFVVCAAVVLRAGRSTARGIRSGVAMALGYAAIAAPFLAWRWRYYGHPLPNTFYLKTSGRRWVTLQIGSNYLFHALVDLGPWLVLAVAVALFAGRRWQPAITDIHRDSRRRAARTIAQWTLVPYVLYVLTVGGDFLDLYRFFVPLLPMAVCLVGVLAEDLYARSTTGPRRRAWIAAVSLFAMLHVANHQWIGYRTRHVQSGWLIRSGIEPLGWTRSFARNWSAVGRWIAERAQPGDWMAVGAAGAMPYHARIRNLDLIGLCDEFIARHGEELGTRPGHTRFAPRWYIWATHPVFLFDGTDVVSPTRRDPPPVGDSAANNYVWVEARITRERYGAESDYFHYLLMPRERAEALGADPFARIAGPQPH